MTALLACAGCATPPQWRAPSDVRAPDKEVAAALGDTYAGRTRVAEPTAAWGEPPEPRNLRPCCAFGDDFKITYGVIPIPGYVLRNLRGLEDVGPHKYDMGVLGSAPSADPGGLERENNGLLYTCRAGFIDLAHLRSHADLTVFLAAQIERRLDEGGVIELEDQGGTRRIRLRAVDARVLADVGRPALAIGMAQWLAVHLSTWHEIATWYGFAEVPFWPEKMSAFSPEDHYSSVVGIKLAGGILQSNEAGDDLAYGRAMNAWIKTALERMQVTSKEDATTAMYAVAGRWWDPSKRLPDWQLLLRRNFEVGGSLQPWLVPMAFAPAAGPSIGCDHAGPPLRIRVPVALEGVRFDRHATLRIDVAAGVAANGLPLPRRGARRITQADLPGIVERTRRKAVAEFGRDYDRP